MKYDVVIIGSGLGGLQCAYILSREGYNVCVLEKNSQLGGCLQTFRRNKILFDTGMHYIGSMDEGQVLNRFFSYFRLTDRLTIRRMDEEGYDVIRYRSNDYKFAMGYERFTDTMLGYFPDERDALKKYTEKLKEISGSIDLYNLRDSAHSQIGYFGYFSTGFDDFLNSITTNTTLKNVLLGLSPLYAGVKDRTPVYIPAIIHSSFINSAYRIIGGGSQISDILAGYIREYGGTLMTKAAVTNLVFNAGRLTGVKINDSETIEGGWFISNIHPRRLLEIAEEAPLRPAYKNRVLGIEETHGVFTLYLAMKKNTFEYMNRNYYVFRVNDIWEYTQDTTDFPVGYSMHLSPSVDNEKYAGSIVINTYMSWDDVRQWENTTVGQRGEEYLRFKKLHAERLLDVLEEDFPGLRSKIEAYYTSTPLTYRDYTGTHKGSIYGFLKNFNDPFRTMVLPRTSIPNLFLTGQNTNVHGAVGVTLGSFITCGEILGTQYLIDKMRNA